jgi:hypothetical protein
MSLYDQAIDLQLKLDTAQAIDSGLELVAKADNLVEALDNAAGYLTGIKRFQVHLGLTESPPVDGKAIATAITAFRAGLSRYGAKASQQQPAANLVKTAKDQRARAASWAVARWRNIFDAYQSLVDQVQSGQLLGGSTHRFTAERKATKLSMLARQDPVADEGKVIAELCDGDTNASWLQRVKLLGDELAGALQALDDERAALTPEVQKALDRATSDDGLPLAEVTAQLLDALHTAGVGDDLVVRRQ